MEKHKIYKIEEEMFDITFNKIENIYESLFLMNFFCKENKYDKNINHIVPSLMFALREAEQLYMYYINKKGADDYEAITFHM